MDELKQNAYVAALVNQRNAAMNEVVNLYGEIARLEAQLAALEASIVNSADVKASE